MAGCYAATRVAENPRTSPRRPTRRRRSAATVKGNPTYQYQSPTPEYQPPGGYPPPSGYPAPAGAYPPGGPVYPGYAGTGRRTNGLAIAAFICSLAGFVTLISAPVGAVLGHIAKRQIAQTGEEGAGFAQAAIIVGWAITGVVLLVCCIGAIVFFAAAGSNV